MSRGNKRPRAMDALMAPRSVAVVGASDKANVGGRIYRNMLGRGFSGPLYPVNPNYKRVGGQPCWADIDSLPEIPDCVAIAVPVHGVFEPLEAAARKGVRAAVVMAEGFNDAGTPEGRARTARQGDDPAPPLRAAASGEENPCRTKTKAQISLIPRKWPP